MKIKLVSPKYSAVSFLEEELDTNAIIKNKNYFARSPKEIVSKFFPL